MTAANEHARRTRVAYYGGSFDPPHRGHLEIASKLIGQFRLDEFVFIPAFHAPHKVRLKPTSPYHRYAMLCLATADDPNVTVSRIEIEAPERPYSIETLTKLTKQRPSEEIFFVMGADSWADIRTWRKWESVLAISNHIVVTRPGYEIEVDHVTDEARSRIVDLRNGRGEVVDSDRGVFITDAVNRDISATRIRALVREGVDLWRGDVTPEVAKYIEKYQIY